MPFCSHFFANVLRSITLTIIITRLQLLRWTTAPTTSAVATVRLVMEPIQPVVYWVPTTASCPSAVTIAVVRALHGCTSSPAATSLDQLGGVNAASADPTVCQPVYPSAAEFRLAQLPIPVHGGRDQLGQEL